MKYAFTIIFLFGAVMVACACTCHHPPLSEAVEGADEIFIGRAVKIEKKRYIFPIKISEIFPVYIYHYWTVTFEVSKKWKGGRNSKVLVAQIFSSCELDIEFMHEYLIFANQSGYRNWDGRKKYTTWLCSRSINTKYFTEWEYQDWVWDDREELDEMFLDGVKVSSLYNIAPIWFLLTLFGIGFVVYCFRKRNKPVSP